MTLENAVVPNNWRELKGETCDESDNQILN